jgi:glucose-1-phosphate thymidylyltransferase
MIHYAAHSVKTLGFDSAMYVTTPDTLSPLAHTLSSIDSHVPYFTVQHAPTGIAHAILQTKDYCNDGPVMVILGDNLFTMDDLENIKEGVLSDYQDRGCHFWTKTVENPIDYGVYDPESNSIEEKPKSPKTSMAVVGLYVFDSNVWRHISKLTPSARGEYEVTDLLNVYLKGEILRAAKHRELEGRWFDLGRSTTEYNKISALYSGLKIL